MAYSRTVGLPILAVVLLLFPGQMLHSQLLHSNPAEDQDIIQPGGEGQGRSSGEGQPAASLKAYTRMVVVDVVVRDKKGELVRDLQASDFKLLEDGKEQKISSFNFQQLLPEAAPPAMPAGIFPANIFRNRPGYQANGALNIILLDGLNSTLLEQAYVRSEMVNFLDKLPQGHPVAIYTLGRKLRLLQDFTTDLTELKKVIRAFKGEASHVLPSASGAPPTPIELQGWAAQTADTFSPQFKAQIQEFANEYSSDQMDERVGRTLGALTSLARMLSGYPGRKNLLWVSDGIPLTVVPVVSVPRSADVSSADGSNVVAANTNSSLPGRSGGAHGQRSYTDQLALLGNLFTDAQIAVYPIDARGLVGSPFFNVSNNVSGQGAAGGLAMSMEGKQAEELFQAHVNMNEIADQTGGQAFYNRNDIENALRNDIEDGSSYYTLAYYPENKEWNGRFRKIKISSHRTDIRLRYRTGYYAIDRVAFMKQHPQQRDLDLSQALSIDAPMATAVQFQAAIAPMAGDHHKEITVNYAVDPHSIRMERGTDGLEHAQLDCVVEAFTVASGASPVKIAASRVNAAITSETYQKMMERYLPCHVILGLPEGSYYLRLAVRDNLTGLMGTLNARATVPAEANLTKP